MLLQTNSYIVPKERRAEHARLLRRFRQVLLRLGCEEFEAYEQMGANWNAGEATGRFVQIMRFRDRKHQKAVHAAEQSEPAAQQLIQEFCELINLPYQQQHGLLAVGYYTAVPEARAGAKGRPPAAVEEGPGTPTAPTSGFGLGGMAAGAALGAAAVEIPAFGSETVEHAPVDLDADDELADADASSDLGSMGDEEFSPFDADALPEAAGDEAHEVGELEEGFDAQVRDEAPVDTATTGEPSEASEPSEAPDWLPPAVPGDALSELELNGLEHGTLVTDAALVDEPLDVATEDLQSLGSEDVEPEATAPAEMAWSDDYALASHVPEAETDGGNEVAGDLASASAEEIEQGLANVETVVTEEEAEALDVDSLLSGWGATPTAETTPPPLPTPPGEPDAGEAVMVGELDEMLAEGPAGDSAVSGEAGPDSTFGSGEAADLPMSVESASPFAEDAEASTPGGSEADWELPPLELDERPEDRAASADLSTGLEPLALDDAADDGHAGADAAVPMATGELAAAELDSPAEAEAEADDVVGLDAFEIDGPAAEVGDEPAFDPIEAEVPVAEVAEEEPAVGAVAGDLPTVLSAEEGEIEILFELPYDPAAGTNDDGDEIGIYDAPAEASDELDATFDEVLGQPQR